MACVYAAYNSLINYRANSKLTAQQFLDIDEIIRLLGEALG